MKYNDRHRNKPIFEDYWLDVAEPVARELARIHFLQLDWVIADNPIERRVDQHMYKVGETEISGHLELESFGRFINGTYNSPKLKGVTIPIRKLKFFRPDLDCYWMCVSVDFTHYILLRGELIRECSMVPNKVRNNDKEEYFYLYDKEPIEDLVREFSPQVIAVNKHLIDVALEEAKRQGII